MIDTITPRDLVLADRLLSVEKIARAAGAEAMRFYGAVSATYKSENSPVTAADHAANDLIVSELKRLFPDDAILSEESADSTDRLAAERVWIVDPLDGTKEFLAQNGEFSIMIGLVVGGEPVLGVVYRPDGDTLFSAAKGQGSRRSRAGTSERMRCVPTDRASLRFVGSRSHSDPLLLEIQQELGITDVQPSGSVGLKCSLIAEGRRDLYVHPVGYLKEWDTCAPEVILREAGGFVTDCRGEPLRYNKPNPAQPDGILALGDPTATDVIDSVVSIYRRAAGAG